SDDMKNAAVEKPPLLSSFDTLFFGIGLAISVFVAVIGALPGELVSTRGFGYAAIFVLLYRILWKPAPYFPFAVAGLWAAWSVKDAWRRGELTLAAELVSAALSFALLIGGYFLNRFASDNSDSNNVIGRKSEFQNDLRMHWAIAWLVNSAMLVCMIVEMALQEPISLMGTGRGKYAGVELGLGSLAVTAWALGMLVKKLRFGVARIQIHGKIQVGGNLNADIIVPRRLARAEKARLHLRCERRYEERERPSEMLWQDEQTVPVSAPVEGLPTRAAMHFALPADLPPSHGDDGTPEAVDWILSVQILLRGVDYRDEFHVKVRAPQSES
ncbi:MAG TPA: hypothetical protein VMU17_06125, partial [Elusimicrobiota bacterium]|nr:hypothetical protein [Elusimicrobiota bacterium]